MLSVGKFVGSVFHQVLAVILNKRLYNLALHTACQALHQTLAHIQHLNTHYMTLEKKTIMWYDGFINAFSLHQNTNRNRLFRFSFSHTKVA